MNTFTFTERQDDSFSNWLYDGIKQSFSAKGYQFQSSIENPKLVFHFVDVNKPIPYRRNSQGTFVVSIVTTTQAPKNIHKEAYPYLIRTLSNHLMYIVRNQSKSTFYFLTPEQGLYTLTYRADQEASSVFFNKLFERLEPLASSQLIINNEFYENLPKALWDGDEITGALRQAGKRLAKMNLLPAPFPLEEVLTARDIRHLKKLYGIGGLSYGNLSARKDHESFWMSASGIDKANMNEVGRDFLYISGYDTRKKAMKVSVPPNITPKRASVDAIEHWMIYKEHPDVNAIVHIHAWMEGIQATTYNYPCGTIELAQTVAELVRSAPDPSRTVIGLKNHGLTITGRSIEEIFDRIEGKILPQVPMLS